MNLWFAIYIYIYIYIYTHTYIHTAWFKKMDSISYIYISGTIQDMWMTYIAFERGGPIFSNNTARALARRTAVQQRQLRAKRLLCNPRFCACVSSLKQSRQLLCSVRFVFVSTFNLQTRKSICRRNHQFEQTGCLCKGKSSGQPRVSQENVRRIQDSF